MTAIARLSNVIRRPLRIALVLALISADAGTSASAQERESLTNLVFEPVMLNNRAADPFQGADDVDAERLVESVEELEATIREFEQDGDQYNPRLAELYDSLGSTHQQLGNHAAALTAYENAVQVTKVNDGLENLRQIPYLEKAVESHIALGDFAGAETTREHIFFLQQRNFDAGDEELLTAMEDFADWNLAAYYRENYRPDQPGLRITNNTMNRTQRNIMGFGERERSEFDGQPVLEGFGSLRLPPLFGGYSPMMLAIFDGSVKNISPGQLIDRRVRRIDSIYQAMQRTLATQESAPAGLVLEIGRRIAGLSYILKQEQDYERRNPVNNQNYEGSREQEIRNSQEWLDQSYRSGRNALERRIELIRQLDAAPPEFVASTLLDLADWHLVYGMIRPAEEQYREAHQLLRGAGYDNATINPAIPPQIPTFGIHLYTRESTGLEGVRLESRGYIDTVLRIDRLGHVDGITFLGSSGDNIRRIREVLRNHLQTVRFRPVLAEGGELQSPDPLRLRYYYSY